MYGTIKEEWSIHNTELLELLVQKHQFLKKIGNIIKVHGICKIHTLSNTISNTISTSWKTN